MNRRKTPLMGFPERLYDKWLASGMTQRQLGKYAYCHCGARMAESEETEAWNGIHAQITAPKGTFEGIATRNTDTILAE